jgi:hypothetical protein
MFSWAESRPTLVPVRRSICDGSLTPTRSNGVSSRSRTRISHGGVASEGVCHAASLLSRRSRSMSSDQAAENAEDPGHRSFIIMPATETFDSQQRVFSRAAYDLQVLATAHSASCGHPGFVPDDYLEHLDGLSIETTITAAELCTIGVWQRVDGGYRVLDWEAVEVCLDQVRQIRGEDPRARARAWEREREALVQAQMAKPMVVIPPCAACGTPAARIELVAPGQVPAEWEQRPSTVRAGIVRQREPGQ